MWSGIVHHKSRPQNMCLNHSWPQQRTWHRKIILITSDFINNIIILPLITSSLYFSRIYRPQNNCLQCFRWKYLWNLHHRNIIEYVTFSSSNYASSLWIAEHRWSVTETFWYPLDRQLHSAITQWALVGTSSVWQKLKKMSFQSFISCIAI